MTTVLLAPELMGSNGGIPRILRLYLKALCDLAAPTDRIRFTSLNDGAVDSSELNNYSSARLESWATCDHRKLRFVNSSLKQARNCERIVCGHVAQLPVAWLCRQLNPGLRYYLVAHGIEVWRPFTFAERLALRNAQRIFCVSEYTRRELLKNVALSPDQVAVLPNALDPFFKVSPGRPYADCPPVILTVTRLTHADRYKGVDHMIAAMPAVRALIPGATLRIVGHGDDVPRLRALATTHGVMNRGVEFAGFVEDRQLDLELRSCRVFALPSKSEGFGLAILEAMAHGRPCLGAQAGGIPEIITDETGLLVPFGDVAAIAAGCILALRRDWHEAAILDRARQFSYSPFKVRLASLLSA